MFFCFVEVDIIKALEEKIIKEGQVLDGDILRVSGFINQQIDIDFLREMGKEIKRLFEKDEITKILTVEASGIAIAVAAAYEIGVPVVFAKKGSPKNLPDNCYTAEVTSYTRKTTGIISVSRDYINKEDKILLLDDFLATGEALKGLESIAKSAEATIVGAVTVIEKGFQKGGDEMRARGLRVESLAIIDKMKDKEILFRPQ